LSYHSQPQTVETEQATGQQQVLIEALPPVLVIHIKRFFYDTASGGVVKVGKQVRFGAELDVGCGRFYLFIFWVFIGWK
jgi:ubiquitin carboxyl-terminal hydrolase 10